MDKQTFIDKIKSLFSEVEEEVKAEFLDVTTEDGVKLRVKEEEIAEGVQVYVVGEDGEEVLAPEGDHAIEGKIITTDADGKVVGIKDPEEVAEVEEPKKEEEVKAMDCECEGEEGCECDKMESELSEEVKKDKDLEARFLALETSLANISESMSAIDSLSKAVSDLANSPSEGEIKLSKANSKGVKKVSAREERVIAFSKRSK